MKKLFLFPLFILVLSACTTTQELSTDLSTNDFTPPSEVERGMENAGPFEQRLLSARSEDGITWERTNIILSEQANTPDMVYTNGLIYLYYTGGNFDGKEQAIAVAVSQDEGVTWTFKRVTLDGIDELGGSPGDPDIIMLDDGTFRLYFTSGLKGEKHPAIFYAEGSDGFNFEYKGQAFYADGYEAIDSSAFVVNSEWKMLTFNGFGTEVIHASSSDDGKSFEFIKTEAVESGKEDYFLANPFELEDGSVRFYAFNMNQFRSFTTQDGLNWEDDGYSYLKYEEGVNSLEGFYIKDPSVIQLNDGSYLMVYVTRAPLNE